MGGLRELWGDGCVIILIVVMLSQVYASVRTFQIGNFKYVHLLHSTYTSVKLFYFKCCLLPHSRQSPGLRQVGELPEEDCR